MKYKDLIFTELIDNIYSDYDKILRDTIKQPELDWEADFKGEEDRPDYFLGGIFREVSFSNGMLFEISIFESDKDKPVFIFEMEHPLIKEYEDKYGDTYALPEQFARELFYRLQNLN